jgi:hypothetical protein
VYASTSSGGYQTEAFALGPPRIIFRNISLSKMRASCRAATSFSISCKRKIFVL